jgi:hypothetical protein
VTQEIRIIGDLVQLVETTVSRIVPLSDWLPLIERRMPVAFPVLPSSTRAVWWDPRGTHAQLIIMLEREPHTAYITYGSKVYAIGVPWTRMIFLATNNDLQHESSWRLDDYKILWSKNRYTDPNISDMCAALLPNVYRDGRICFGSTGVSASNSLADRLDMTLNGFYASTFNNDLSVRYPADYTSFSAWQKGTRHDANAWQNWPQLDIDQNPDCYSWADISREFGQEGDARTVPIVAADPIPDFPRMPSFGHAHEWLAGLDGSARNALRRALALTEADPEPDNTPPTEIDNDNPTAE